MFIPLDIYKKQCKATGTQNKYEIVTYMFHCLSKPLCLGEILAIKNYFFCFVPLTYISIYIYIYIIFIHLHTSLQAFHKNPVGVSCLLSTFFATFSNVFIFVMRFDCHIHSKLFLTGIFLFIGGDHRIQASHSALNPVASPNQGSYLDCKYSF